MHDHEDYLDSDGYPTEETLSKISTWDYRDKSGCFQFIQSLWCWEDFWNTEDTTNEWGQKVRIHHVSTGGWSGNESLIYALQKNFIIWSSTWVQSRRGGHYIFEEKEMPSQRRKDEPPEPTHLRGLEYTFEEIKDDDKSN